METIFVEVINLEELDLQHNEVQIIDQEDLANETEEGEIPLMGSNNRKEEINKEVEQQETKIHQRPLDKGDESLIERKDQGITKN